MLSQYVIEREDELSLEKLHDLLGLKYGRPTDAVRQLDGVAEMRDRFIGVQRGVYDGDDKWMG